ncbi:hypothetical protein CHS0354_015560 [Potamilus streckersoni]|uniref:Uncharacterized protein n=1 Tax=Potamilus streckersoni TaxID=2493646 RepID=A0AAE0SW46_9BIVA|nr:hypothetical protein CHS0354_015560 [Potamilus streckersoni]
MPTPSTRETVNEVASQKKCAVPEALARHYRLLEEEAERNLVHFTKLLSHFDYYNGHRVLEVRTGPTQPGAPAAILGQSVRATKNQSIS